MIWLYFNGEIPEGYEINHIDGDKRNNRPSNFELVTHKRNLQHASETGLLKKGWTRSGSIMNEEEYRILERLLKENSRPVNRIREENFPHIKKSTFYAIAKNIKEGKYDL